MEMKTYHMKTYFVMTNYDNKFSETNRQSRKSWYFYLLLCLNSHHSRPTLLNHSIDKVVLHLTLPRVVSDLLRDLRIHIDAMRWLQLGTWQRDSCHWSRKGLQDSQSNWSQGSLLRLCGIQPQTGSTASLTLAALFNHLQPSWPPCKRMQKIHDTRDTRDTRAVNGTLRPLAERTLQTDNRLPMWN